MVTAAAVVVVVRADPLELWDPIPPVFGRIPAPANTEMRMITITPATKIIFFLFFGFFGDSGTVAGMDDGTSRVGGRSIGEKRLGIHRFFAGSESEGSAATAGCSRPTGGAEN